MSDPDAAPVVWHPIGPGFAPIRAGGGTPSFGKTRPLLPLLPGQTRSFDAAGIETVTTYAMAGRV